MGGQRGGRVRARVCVNGLMCAWVRGYVRFFFVCVDVCRLMCVCVCVCVVPSFQLFDLFWGGEVRGQGRVQQGRCGPPPILAVRHYDW